MISVDNEPPTFDNPPDDILLTLDGNVDVVATWPEVTATDNAGGSVNLTSNYHSGDRFTAGTVLVILDAVDEYGNSASDSFYINVMGKHN